MTNDNRKPTETLRRTLDAFECLNSTMTASMLEICARDGVEIATFALRQSYVRGREDRT